ncbi:proline-rich receptor-like protein kinase PERK2 [Oryza sativa Japonica Group]|uniref:proline-rich receptor-like protein kinase PERK2 n=1 Tax=Oryza sativa subsp. japonica TaxID=39947 RepID=UPI00339CC850
MAAFHGRRAPFPPPFPAPPVAGSLPTPIKWNPHPSFYRFSPFPSLPVVVSPLPAFSFSLSDAGRPPAASPSSPERRPVAPSPPSASQPPPLPRSALRFAGKSPETCPRRQNSGVAATVLPPAAPAAPLRCGPAAPSPPSASPRRPPPRPALGFTGTPSSASVSPSASPEFLRQPRPPCLCAGRRRHLHPRHCSGKVALALALALASPPPERRRCPSSSSPFILAGSSSRGAASVVGIAAACSSPSSPPCSRCRLPSSSPRRPRSSSSSSSRRSRSSWRSSLRQAVLVRRPRSSSVPLQPRRRLRPRLRVVKPHAGRVSPSSKDRRRSCPLAVRPRSSRPPPPRPFVVVVPTPRRVVACSFACVLRVASVVPEVPEAWFAVVAEGSEGRSL